MEEPSPRRSRLVIAGCLAAMLVIGGGGFLLGRGTDQPTEVVAAPPATAPRSLPAPRAEPFSSGVLGRADLIQLAAAAADEMTGGSPTNQVAQIHGRRFEVRLPFGCDGPAPKDSAAAMRWRYDPESQVLRIHVRPVTWSAEMWTGEAAPEVEAIEGFWVARPWTASEACPAGGDPPTVIRTEPVTLPGQTLALGQVFSAEGARGGRRDGEAFETVVRVPEGELDRLAGFRLRISGRITRLPGNQTVRCRQPGGPEQRPICLVGVVINELAIENPANSETLASWTLGGRSTTEGLAR